MNDIIKLVNEIQATEDQTTEGQTTDNEDQKAEEQNVDNEDQTTTTEDQTTTTEDQTTDNEDQKADNEDQTTDNEDPFAEIDPNDLDDTEVIAKVGDVGLTAKQIYENHRAGLRLQDYTKKTTELSEQRNTFEQEKQEVQEVVKDAQAKNKQYLDTYGNIEQILGELEAIKQTIYRSPEELQQVLHNNPEEYQHYIQFMNAVDANKNKLDTLKQDQEKASQLEMKQKQTAYITEQEKVLKSYGPHWSDEKIKENFEAVMDYVKPFGITPQELMYAPLLNMAYKAMSYDKSIKQAKQARTKVQKEGKTGSKGGKVVDVLDRGKGKRKPPKSTGTDPKNFDELMKQIQEQNS